MNVEASEVVRADAAAVFALATDPARMAEWQAGVADVAVVDDAPQAGVGSRLSGSRAYGGMRLPFTFEVTAWQPPRRYAFASVEGPVRLRGEQRVEPRPEGCEVTLSLEVRLPGLGLLGAADPVRARVRSALAEDLTALRRLAETGA